MTELAKLSKPTTDTTIICSTCHIKFSSLLAYKVHLGTEFHSYNTKRRIAQLDPITETIFEQKKALLMSAIDSQASSAVSFKCAPCNKSFKSIEQLDQHKKSKKHKKNQKDNAPGENKPEGSSVNTSSSMFKEISQATIDGSVVVEN